MAELRERLVEELDYTQRGGATSRSSPRYYDGHPTIHVPEVIPRSRRGGCSPPSCPTGCGGDELLTWAQDEKDLAAETIYRFAFGSLYRLAAFNGDPHPGNYLFHPGGRVTFLDFGLVKHFTPPSSTSSAR